MFASHRRPGALALTLAIWLCASLNALSADVLAAEVECLPGTGVWHATSDEEGSPLELRAALCDSPRATCPDFTTLTFAADGKPTAGRTALTPTRFHTCDLVGQGALGDHALYHDPVDKVLTVVDGESLRVVARLPQAGPARVVRAPATETGPPRVLLVGDDEILVVEPGADGVPAIVSREAFADLIEIHFVTGRIVAVGARVIVHWPVDVATGKLGAAGRLPAGEGVEAGGYAVDPNAVLRAVEDDRRVLWQPFDDRKPRIFSLRDAEVLLGFGASATSAAAVVAAPESENTEVYALAPDGLVPRIEPRRVKLTPEDVQDVDGATRRVLNGGGRWLLLDMGRERAGVLPIDTEEFASWKLRRPISYSRKGRVIYVDDTQYFVYHPEGTYALSHLSVPGGSRKARVRRSRLDELDNEIVAVEPLTGRLTLVVGKNGRRAILNRKTQEIDPWPAPPEGTELLGEPIVLPGDRFLVAYGKPASEGTAARVSLWRTVDYDSKAVDLAPSVPLADAASMAERLFGYCVAGEASCAIELPQVEPLEGSVADVTDLATEEVAGSLLLPIIALLGGVLLLILVTLYKTDAFRSASPIIKRAESPDRFDEASRVFIVGSQVAFDPKGRRVPFETDLDGYVHRSAWTRKPLRIATAAVASLALALPLTITRLAGESIVSWLLVTLAIAAPMFALVWVAMSWKMWNRLHLLRFGKAVEGSWIDRDKGRPRAVFVVAHENNLTLALASADTTRALPVVLYDPKRPRFATDYNGASNLDPQTTGHPGQLAGVASSLQPIGWIVATVLLAGLVATAIAGRFAAFPASMPEGRLQELASADPDGLLLPCQAECGDDAACLDQCEHRQLRLTLESGGIEIDGDGDPATSAAELRTALADRIDAWIAGVQGVAPTTLCSTHAESLPELRVWTPTLHDAFHASYGQPEVLEANAALAGAEARIAEARATFFEPLCAPSAACQADRKACKIDLACAGSPRAIQERACAAAPRIVPLSATMTAEPATSPAPSR